LNRQAGRGNAPPDSSFHKNLPQVEKWIDMLAKEAGQREKKDMKFWGAIVEVVQVCRLGIKKEAKGRIGAKEMDQKIAGWVDWGLGRRRKCNCEIKEEKEVIQGVGFSDTTSEPEAASQYRISRLQGSKQQQILGPIRQKVELSGEGPGEAYVAESIMVGPGSTRAPSVDPYESSVWGIGDLANLHQDTPRHGSIASNKSDPSIASSRRPSTVWGLDDVCEDDRMDEIFAKGDAARRSESGISVSTSCIAIGVGGGASNCDEDQDEDDEENDDGGGSTDTETQREDWPLPLGTLTMS